MKHLIIKMGKTDNWSDLNKIILLTYVKGYFTIAPITGECQRSKDLYFVKPHSVCVLHNEYIGYPIQGECAYESDAICVAEKTGNYIQHVARLEDYGITWWITKDQAEEALKTVPDDFIDVEIA